MLRSILHKELRHVHRPRKGQWALCSVCAALDAALHIHDLEPVEREDLRRQQATHRKAARLERDVFAAHQAECRANPSRSFMVLADLTRPAEFPNVEPSNAVIVHCQSPLC